MKGLKRTCRCAELSEANVGSEVTVMGWVQKQRNKGGIIFVDMRDRSGILQVIFEDGEIDKEQGETMDISNNGLAVYMNRWFEVGESCIFTLPRIGTLSDGVAEQEVVGVVCWVRELPKGDSFRFVCGIQLRFANLEERRKMQEYVMYVKKRYKL